MAEAPRAPSSVKKAPIVDNFALLFYDKDGHSDFVDKCKDEKGDVQLTEEELFRKKVYTTLERVEQVRDEITDKYLAKQLTEEKLCAQLYELKQQSRFNALNTQKKQAIKVNYQRKLLLCQKIYTLTVQLQTLYIELANMIEKRIEHTMEIHRISRLCVTALYEYKKRTKDTPV
ncbi:IMP-specific 5 -nucleotidase, putative [Babesia ovis]|uniref:IMP-specific 5 -nucleotidase, putative n=1 Tax=Babesia ovis TaxID=5869 RepID=A0A9W5TCJ7_BABOV|nr:IMP-specific 5 -nucleotidase, putative [Babesia ovis]